MPKMSLEKAIETLEELLKVEKTDGLPEGVSAIKLGIEALKRIQEYRSKYLGSMNNPLPGEAKE